MIKKGLPWLGVALAGALIVAAAVIRPPRPTAPVLAQPQALASSSPRLAAPPLPEYPTQVEWGRYLFWLNCMTCHGDRGQGLTDEFRSLWDPDHQNCWGRGCHSGHREDEGFPLPRSIPAIISPDGKLPPFPTADRLFNFLRTTHPPQHPGYLPEDQYWAISAYVLTESGRLPAGQVLGPAAGTLVWSEAWPTATLGLLAMMLTAILLRLRNRGGKNGG